MIGERLTIGRLARLAGVHVETVRYYQRIGLIEVPERPVSGFRVYTRETAERLGFIRRARGLGFSLDEIGRLLELGDGRCRDVLEQAEARLERIEGQIRDLEAMRRALRALIEDCRRAPRPDRCPLIETLRRRSGRPSP